jgi:hypothetical protein
MTRLVILDILHPIKETYIVVNKTVLRLATEQSVGMKKLQWFWSSPAPHAYSSFVATKSGR